MARNVRPMRKAVWIPIVVVVLLLAIFHDSPIVLSLWHVAQALGNVWLALSSKFSGAT